MDDLASTESTFFTVSTLDDSDITTEASAELAAVANQVDSGTLKNNDDLSRPLDPIKFALTNGTCTQKLDVMHPAIALNERRLRLYVLFELCRSRGCSNG